MMNEMKKINSKVMIRCECGKELMLVPDVKAMGNAIEVHVANHLQKGQASKCTDADAERLRDALIAQVLKILGQSENDGVSDGCQDYG